MKDRSEILKKEDEANITNVSLEMEYGLKSKHKRELSKKNKIICFGIIITLILLMAIIIHEATTVCRGDERGKRWNLMCFNTLQIIAR